MSASAAILDEARRFVAAARQLLQEGQHQHQQPVQILTASSSADDAGDEEGTTAVLAGLLDMYDVYCFDCDGVLWRGAELLPGAAATLALLRAKGKRLFFVTNNSSKSRAQYLDKFAKLGIQASLEEILPSSWAAAEYLRSEHPAVRKAFVIGSQGLVDELALVGVESVGGADPAYASRMFRSEAEFLEAEADPEVGAVVCGWDLTFNFAKLCLASLHLQRGGSGLAFVATNRDAFDKLHDRNVPGNGCAVAALETAAGRAAVTVGKPSPWLIRHILAAHGLDPRRTVVVGDRLDTDIQLGVRGGTDSILVGTGCATLADLEQAAATGDGDGEMGLPTYIISHVGALHEAAANGGGGGGHQP